jgi:hypothetical protein
MDLDSLVLPGDVRDAQQGRPICFYKECNSADSNMAPVAFFMSLS